jgi:hypothetical protein
VFQPLVDRAPQRLAHRLAARGQKAGAVVSRNRIPPRGWRIRETHLGCRVRDFIRVGEVDGDGGAVVLAHTIVLSCPQPYISADVRKPQPRNP